jgi:hypothetical protein
MYRLKLLDAGVPEKGRERKDEGLVRCLTADFL